MPTNPAGLVFLRVSACHKLVMPGLVPGIHVFVFR
jgi:hypothetical protein